MLNIYLLMFVSLDIFVWAPETFLCTSYHSSESLTEAPDLVAGLWRHLYVEWRNYAINYVKQPIVKLAQLVRAPGHKQDLMNQVQAWVWS
jgi:hypothetical protein